MVYSLLEKICKKISKDCKLCLKETICIKWQTDFVGKIKKDISKYRLLKYQLSMQSVKKAKLYEGPVKSFVTGFGLLQYYVLLNISLLQTFKVFSLN